MNTYFMIAEMLGGLALFLYGMQIMGDGLKSTSAGTLKKVLDKVTSNPVKSFLLGLFITCIIQSSTATIALAVGLISAGVLNLKQCVGIVMGANVGTTITAQILRLMDVESSGAGLLDLFTPESLAPIAAVIGIVLIMFVKKGKSKNLGHVAIGFGILFTGLINMTDAMAPLGESEAFKNLIIHFSSNPFFGIAIGTVITAVVQSSSASVGILQSLSSSTGAMVFNFSYGYVIGAALGTCVAITIVCCIGTKEDAKRVGFIHAFFNIVGSLMCLFVMEGIHWAGLLPNLWSAPMTSGNIADFQTVFKLVTAIVLLPFSSALIKLSKRIIKDKPLEEGEAEIEDNLRELNQQLLASPVLALAQVKHLLGHMCELSIKNYNSAVSLLLEYDESKIEKVSEREALIDKMADSTNNYLIMLSPHMENPKDNKMQNFLLQALTEFERIGDLAKNLADAAGELAAGGRSFSDTAKKELVIITDAVRRALEFSYKAFTETDYETAALIEPLEEVIDDLNEMLRKRHIERLKQKRCSVTCGIHFLDVLTNLERLGDQCSDIAVYVLGLKDDSITGNEHEYIHKLHKEHDSDYAREFANNRKLYIDRLTDLPIES